jgi:hypothetical protein
MAGALCAGKASLSFVSEGAQAANKDNPANTKTQRMRTPLPFFPLFASSQGFFKALV